MSFSHDRRGQSVVVGTVILFGFLILALSVYQVQFVPAENEEIEFEHSQQVEGDFQDLRNGILQAGSTGEARSTSIRLGTRYPQRTFFLNPPAPTGELSTSDPGEVRIEGASVDAEGNVGEYWNAPENELNFSTRSVRYSPNYNEFRNGPDLAYEHSLVAAEFGGAVLARTGQTLVDGDSISLTTINGTVSESGVERRSVDPKPRSQSQRMVTLDRQTEVDPIVVVLPTSVPEGDKRAALAEEWDDRLDEDGDATATAEGVRLEIFQDEYELQLSSVGFRNSDPVDAAYITAVGDRTVTPGDRITAEVRDEFNNPVRGVTVTVDETGEERRTDTEGRVNVDAADAGESRTLRIGDDSDYESVTFNSVADEGGASETRTFDVEWQGPDPREVVGAGEETVTVQVTDRDSGTAIEGANVNISTAVTSGSGPSDISPSEPVTDEDGEVDVTVDVDENTENDEFDLYASAGDDVDQLTIQIVADEGENGGGPVNNFEFVSVSNLVEDEDNQEQRFSFTVDGDLIEGNDGEVEIDLTDAQDQGNNAEVQYNGADATVTSGSGTASIDVRGQNADVIYTPGNDGDRPDSEIEIAVSGISVGDNTAGNEYTVDFEHLETETTAETTFGIADTAGDVTISNDIGGNVYSTGSLTIDNDVTIEGNTGADESVTLNDRAEVEGSITSRGSVTLRNDAVVGGDITSEEAVTLNDRAEVEGSITSRGSVTLRNDAVVGGDINSGGTVTLNDRAEVGGDVFVGSASSVVCGQESTINGQPCEEYIDENY